MKNILLSKPQIYIGVQDGGPGGGKTTGMISNIEHARTLDMIPLIVPEAATILLSSGVTRDEAFQEMIIEMQLNNEVLVLRNAEHLLRKYQKSVIIFCDRGLLDGEAYVHDPDEFKKLLKEYKLSKPELFEKHYQFVSHLVTAANGAEEYYSNETNIHRTESAEEARVIDSRLQLAYHGHEHQSIIQNVYNRKKISFEEKIRLNTKSIFESIGLPAPIETERKWAVDGRFTLSMLREETAVHILDIRQTYLVTKKIGDEERVRQKTYTDGNIYFVHTVKRDIGKSERYEFEQQISASKYNSLLLRKDIAKKEIVKTRVSFIFNGQVFTLDMYKHPERSLHKLELEGTLALTSFEQPPFIPIIKEVTGEYEWKDSYLAQTG